MPGYVSTDRKRHFWLGALPSQKSTDDGHYNHAHERHDDQDSKAS